MSTSVLYHAFQIDGVKYNSTSYEDDTLIFNAERKSDSCVLPEKQPNKNGANPLAEDVEGRQLTKGNVLKSAMARTQSRNDVSTGLQRVRIVARREKRARFTNLLHHVNVDLLRESFLYLKKKKEIAYAPPKLAR